MGKGRGKKGETEIKWDARGKRERLSKKSRVQLKLLDFYIKNNYVPKRELKGRKWGGKSAWTSESIIPWHRTSLHPFLAISEGHFNATESQKWFTESKKQLWRVWTSWFQSTNIIFIVLVSYPTVPKQINGKPMRFQCVGCSVLMWSVVSLPSTQMQRNLFRCAF